MHPVGCIVRPVVDRPDQRLVLCAAQSGAGRHFRHAQHHQFQSRRPIYAGRVCRLPDAAIFRARLLACADHCAAGRRPDRRDHRARVFAMAIQARSSLRAAADLRVGADHRRRRPQQVRLGRPALHDAGFAARRSEPRLHVPAELPRLGDRRLARGLHRYLVRHRAHAAWRLSARRHREPDFGARLRHQRAGHDHADLRLRRRTRCFRRRDGRSHL